MATLNWLLVHCTIIESNLSLPYASQYSTTSSTTTIKSFPIQALDERDIASNYVHSCVFIGEKYEYIQAKHMSCSNETFSYFGIVAVLLP